MRENGFKLEDGRCRIDIRKKFFTVRVVRHWHWLPSGCPSLEAFKARLDRTVSNLILEGGVAAYSRGLELGDLKGPFQPKPFYDSMVVQT